MNAPDKIYIDFIDDAICMSSMSETPNGGDVYIRKDALLEWAEEKREWYEGTDFADVYQKVIDKLNSL